MESQQTSQVLTLRARSVPLLALCKGKAPSPAPASGVSSSRYALEGGDGTAFANARLRLTL